MLITLIKEKTESVKCSTLVVFATQPSKKGRGAQIMYPGLNKTLSHSIEDEAITGKHLEVNTFKEINFGGFRHLIVVGLGKENSFDGEEIRQAFAAAYEALKSSKFKEALISLDGITTDEKKLEHFVQAGTEGLVLSSYVFEELKTSPSQLEISVHLYSKSAQLKNIKKAFEKGLIIGSTVNFSRRLGDMPANMMTPANLAEAAIEESAGTGIKVTVWDKARCKKEKMGGLLGVNQGSDQEPRFIIMEYKGGKSSQKPIVFVGKGLTFDCGGISVKPSAGMEEMKYDMCGGANVIGAMVAIARLGLKVNAVGLVPSTENLISGSATKPGDVHRARNGKTFEVNNTDAEGRLILADALSYASELQPQAIFNIATLTGAIIVALGNIHTGFFTRDKKLKTTIEKASTHSGELVWQLPLTDHHVKDMKGTYADLSNISSGKGAGSATAAAFLEQFVGENISWAHFDIAGTGWAVGNRLNYCSKKGASGAMIRTFIELAKEFQN